MINKICLNKNHTTWPLHQVNHASHKVNLHGKFTTSPVYFHTKVDILQSDQVDSFTHVRCWPPWFVSHHVAKTSPYNMWTPAKRGHEIFHLLGHFSLEIMWTTWFSSKDWTHFPSCQICTVIYPPPPPPPPHPQYSFIHTKWFHSSCQSLLRSAPNLEHSPNPKTSQYLRQVLNQSSRTWPVNSRVKPARAMHSGQQRLMRCSKIFVSPL